LRRAWFPAFGPALELLLAQPGRAEADDHGNAPIKVAIEAAVRWGWDAVIGKDV